MVRICSKGLQGSSLETKCQSGFNNEDISDMVPVTSIKSGITYVNKHCYMCNEQDTLDKMEVYSWTPVLMSKRLLFITHYFQSPQSIISALEKSSNILFVAPANVSALPCQIYDVSSCNETCLWDYKDELAEKMCNFGYNLPVIQTIGKKRFSFKNVACVKCNARNDSIEKSLFCGYFQSRTDNIMSLSLNIQNVDFNVNHADTEQFTEFYIKNTTLKQFRRHMCKEGFLYIMVRSLWYIQCRNCTACQC